MSKGIYTIVITGATKGLGRALTEQYIQLGHMVIGCGRSVNSIESMSNSYPENTDFQVVDISDHKRVRFWAEDVLNKFGSPDFLLNNAGIINKNRNILGMMPHPERSCEKSLGSEDGNLIFKSIMNNII